MKWLVGLLVVAFLQGCCCCIPISRPREPEQSHLNSSANDKPKAIDRWNLALSSQLTPDSPESIVFNEVISYRHQGRIREATMYWGEGNAVTDPRSMPGIPLCVVASRGRTYVYQVDRAGNRLELYNDPPTKYRSQDITASPFSLDIESNDKWAICVLSLSD